MDYIERVLSVAKAYDHDTMPIDVQELQDCYERLREENYSLQSLFNSQAEEIERLRAELDSSGMGDYNRLAARLHRIEEAARNVVTSMDPMSKTDALRAALEPEGDERIS